MDSPKAQKHEAGTTFCKSLLPMRGPEILFHSDALNFNKHIYFFQMFRPEEAKEAFISIF